MRFFGFLWAFPTTLVGVVLGLGSMVLGRGKCHLYADAVVEFSGGLYGRWAKRFGATTFGFAVLARNADTMNRLRPHERVHTEQAMWFGPLFLLVYGLSSGWARLRHGNWYWDNWMERQARDRSGVS